ncbi:hypothetical protein OHA84_14885 [Streptomyces sp. NBC_00513]|uniref:hypothetical protein n=1 Tax=unclassified Streptomyces TaxID=2593676 RepID=UPI0022547AC8|nr:hypothetical protein [Streptomyces sp. NBC_00424]MCX5075174.1 hypothetical protein [Streptomyces sp. NBC_00424]WUD41688.1 hypothetical protein OHA84_14885 [Streptomyces sp. NBC_00513]
MHAFAHTDLHTALHAGRTAELAAEAAAWHLARNAAPAASEPALPLLPLLRNRLGEALVAAGIRLMQPAHVHSRVVRGGAS